MSNIEYYSTDMRWGSRSGSVTMHDQLQRGRERSQPEERFGYIAGMIDTAENLAREYHISREESDAFALRSHLRSPSLGRRAFQRRGRSDQRAAAQRRTDSVQPG